MARKAVKLTEEELGLLKARIETRGSLKILAEESGLTRVTIYRAAKGFPMFEQSKDKLFNILKPVGTES